jgi:hypothetical protein
LVGTNKKFVDGKLDIYTGSIPISDLNSKGLIIGLGMSDNTTMSLVYSYLHMYNLWVELTYEATGYEVGIVAYPDKNAGTASWINYTGGTNTWGYEGNRTWRIVEARSDMDLIATPNTSSYYYLDYWDKNGSVITSSTQFNTG